MSIHIDKRPNGRFALYIDGDLQFDTADEALYHESLALPPLCIAQKRKLRDSGSADDLKVLICGGGDGLALREALRFPGVARVDLVDYDPAIVELGKTEIRSLNQDAFDDSRVSVHIEDAWSFIETPNRYDVIICDLTVPRTINETRPFSLEWYRRLSLCLTCNGVMSINGFSPERTPEAFWCLHNSIRAARLTVLPFRVCIPSFRMEGYGAWSFLLAGRDQILRSDLRSLDCPVPTLQADLSQIWRGARFSRADRAMGRSIPPHTLESSELLSMLLNPGSAHRAKPLALRTEVSSRSSEQTYDISPIIDSVPLLHPSHTREMVEALAEHVAGSVRGIDLRELVQALLRRAARLPSELYAELQRLRAFLADHAINIRQMQAWGYRLFAALIIVITLANSISPDAAFGKGSAGIGHASFSRGFSSSSSGVRGGFGGGRGGGESVGSSHTFSSTGRVTGGAFRSGYGHGYASDIYGYSYRPRVFVYYSHGYHSGYGRGSQPSANRGAREEHKTLFIADDDLMVLDNGDVVITLSDTAYMLAKEGALALYSVNSLDPLIELYAEPALFSTIKREIEDQRYTIGTEIAARRDWLSWVGWTSALLPAVRDDWTEIANLRDLDKRLVAASLSTGGPRAASATIAPADSFELFVGTYLLPGGVVAIHSGSGWTYTDGRQLWTGSESTPTNKKACPAELAAVISSVMKKLAKELRGDVLSLSNDSRVLRADRAQLERDLSEYNNLYASHGFDPSYQVDYGTSEMSVSQAIKRTEDDIAANQKEIDDNATERAKTELGIEQIRAYLPGFGH